MSKRCELTGKTVMVGNNVSHANNKTKRRFLPNLQKTRIYSESLKRFFTLKISVSVLKTLDKYEHGFDGFILSAKNDTLSQRAKNIKKAVLNYAKRQEQESIAA